MEGWTDPTEVHFQTPRLIFMRSRNISSVLFWQARIKKHAWLIRLQWCDTNCCRKHQLTVLSHRCGKVPIIYQGSRRHRPLLLSSRFSMLEKGKTLEQRVPNICLFLNAMAGCFGMFLFRLRKWPVAMQITPLLAFTFHAEFNGMTPIPHY